MCTWFWSKSSPTTKRHKTMPKPLKILQRKDAMSSVRRTRRSGEVGSKGERKGKWSVAIPEYIGGIEAPPEKEHVSSKIL